MANPADNTKRVERKCSVEGCGRKHRASGLCDAHHQQHRSAGRPSGTSHFRPLKDCGKRGQTRRCIVAECHSVRSCKGFCQKHYRHWRSAQADICAADLCDRKAMFGHHCESHKKALKNGRPLAALKPANGDVVKWIKAHRTYNDDKCLTWPFARNDDGRAMMDGGGASRAMCAAAHGPAPFKKAYAAHNCGRGHEGCVNPQHLRWATGTQNAADRLLHGTLGRKLCPDDIRTIRVSVLTQVSLAEMFGVSQTMISRIQLRQSWKAVL